MDPYNRNTYQISSHRGCNDIVTNSIMSSISYLDALPYVDKQVEDPSKSIYLVTQPEAYILYLVNKAAAQALVEAELRHTPQIAEDDHRLATSVDVFPVSNSS